VLWQLCLGEKDLMYWLISPLVCTWLPRRFQHVVSCPFLLATFPHILQRDKFNIQENGNTIFSKEISFYPSLDGGKIHWKVLKVWKTLCSSCISGFKDTSPFVMLLNLSVQSNLPISLLCTFLLHISEPLTHPLMTYIVKGWEL